ncbi:pre-peptidase C-terminal domain-containing protein [Stakelama tenebrarum]|uniref:Peptidase C14 caspase catalytic subunit p20 n=1 Tax=Stakelama tenebrarum TaxID=2711215 RepID=A0A6G6Y886_9SPHN|nr:pre-peptidase C-terminal domain-containing protein [Sphingosinithalassobacter tenebrarum]QIG81129.1 hypothetical protein G5C33_15985 [Sphingosinithalassobacter tenebrarum]
MKGKRFPVWFGAIVAAMLATAQPALAQQGFSGELAPGDTQIDTGEYVDAHSFTATAGQRITVTMESDDFDTYLAVSGPGDFAEHNDDATEDSTNSALTFVAPASGEYRILATSYEGGETGRYRGTIDIGGGAVADQSARQTVTGTLSTSDAQLDNGEYFDTYPVTLRAGQRVSIAMESGEFDTYLVVIGPDTEFTRENDDAGDTTTDAALTFTAPTDGEYQIAATSFEGNQTGSYTLTIEGARLTGQAVTQAPVAPAGSGSGFVARLDATDGKLDSGEYRDVYTFSARAGQRVSARAESSDFDTYLMVRGPNDFSEENDDAAEDDRNAALDFATPEEGDYRLVVTSYEAGESGDYNLIVNGVSLDSESVALNQTVYEQTISGALERSDSRLGTGEYTDRYTITARAGQRIALSALSDDFDTYLMVRGPGDFSQDNDDAVAGERNAAMRFTAPADGEYRVIVTSYAEGTTGAYQLSVGGARIDGQGNAAPAQSGNGMTLGTPVRGTLASGDNELRSGEYVDTWELRATPGERIAVRLMSDAIDTYLIVLGTDGRIGENDDDPNGNGSSDAMLELTVPADGRVSIGATSYQPGETGGYTLVAERVGAGTGGSGSSSQNSISVGQTVRGSLGSGEAREGKYEDVYVLRGEAGQSIEIRLDSTAFDPTLAIRGGNGFSDSNDDDPAVENTRNSRLVVTLPQSGTYSLVVSSYEAQATGGYSLSVAPAQAPAGTPATSGGTDMLALGRTATGRLQNGDRQLNSGEYADAYSFAGRAGQEIEIDLNSSDFDPYLILSGPGDFHEENDDAVTESGRSTHDSRIVVTLPEDGTYYVNVTSYQAGETGAYRVGLNAGSGASGMVSNRSASGGGPRVFAVMVGIADYPGTANDLSSTDEDAIKLGETLRRSGLLNPSSVTLVDAQATRAGVRNAIASVAAQAGPEDLFLFFYSGHGNQVPTPVSAEELDGRSETILLYDGQASDNELAQWLSGVRTRMQMVVFDSCFSGGMNNLVNKPNVMGIFSSEEDLTSLVAQKYQAGGYLAYFLRNALSGEADTNHDRVLTAGELTQYLRLKFSAEGPLPASTLDNIRNYQNLTIDRGGVRVDDMVLRL